MVRQTRFEHASKGPRRPQILLIGNGLEYKSGQRSWEKLIQDLTVPERKAMDNPLLEDIPFPLRFELLSTPCNIPSTLTEQDILRQEQRLSEGMKKMVHQSNDLLELLPALGMDHIFTTNYSYCLEQAFYPGRDFAKGRERSRIRFDLRGGKREVQYRLHTGYSGMPTVDSVQETGLWHIHGECGVPRGIVLGHDRYGRLLARIVACCSETRSHLIAAADAPTSFTSWPDLFLFGDVYVLGFGFDLCEFDLWWLLRRKQRERGADGRVRFYDKPSECRTQDGRKRRERTALRNLLLQANGVEILNVGADETTDFDSFYRAAIADIGKRVRAERIGIK